MNIDTIKFNKKDYELLKENFISYTLKSVTQPGTSEFYHSFYFKKNLVDFKRMFSKQEDFTKLLNFFSYKAFDLDDVEAFSLFWNEVYPLLDRFFLDIVREDPERFLRDKRLKIYAGRFLIFDYINKKYTQSRKKDSPNSEKLYILRIDKKPVNIINIVNRRNIYTGIDSINTVELLNDSFILNTFKSKKGKPSLFGKDILNSLIIAIKNNEKLESINKSTFLNKRTKKLETDLKFYFDAIDDVLSKKSYMKKRKTLDIKSITRRNFKSFISEYFYLSITDNYVPIYKYLSKRKIDPKLFRLDMNSEGYNNIKDIVQYLNCDTSYDEHVVKNGNYVRRIPSDKYLFHNIDSFMDRFKDKILLNNSLFYVNKYVNAKKYTYRTKQLLNSNNLLFNLLFTKDEFKSTIIKFIDNLKALNVNEKTIRGFLAKYLNPEVYFSKKNSYLILDEMIIHDISYVVFNNFNSLTSKLKEENFKHPLLLNSLVKIMSHINLDKRSLSKLDNVLSQLSLNSELLKNVEDKRIHQLNDFFEIIAKIKEKSFKNDLVNIKSNMDISKEAFSLSMRMDRYAQFIALLKNISSKRKYLDSFKETNKIKKEILFERDSYNISITHHNNPIGLIGANVNGVCISSYGEARLSQVDANFLNLSIYNESAGIMLWGLLCRAENEEGEVIYILNNLQGSINIHSIAPEDVLDDIYKLFRLLIKNEGLKNILFLDFGFNALRLNSKNVFKPNKFELVKNIRLDFNLKSGEFYSVV